MAEKSSPTESNLHSAVPSGPYTDFIDEVGEMIFILNGQGTILYANGSVFDRLKLGRDLIIGKSFWEFLFPGEMRETAKNTRNRIKKMVRGRSIETTVKDKDGKKHLLSLRVVKLGGGKTGFSDAGCKRYNRGIVTCPETIEGQG